MHLKFKFRLPQILNKLCTQLPLQMKLLNLYIKRAQTGSGAGDAAADVSGQS